MQQAVQEIRTARIAIAKQVNSSIQSTYWNLGKLLFDKLLKEGYEAFFLRMSFHIFTKEGCQIGGQIGGQVQDLIDRDGATIGQWLLTLKRKSNR